MYFLLVFSIFMYIYVYFVSYLFIFCYEKLDPSVVLAL